MTPPQPPPELNRIAIIGATCSGKSTLARELAARLDATHIELDALHWLPDWQERPVDEFRELVRQAVAGERWVTDGNYAKARDQVWGRATDVVWLNHPFPLVARRAISRTVRRVAGAETLYSGNRETFSKAFLSTDSILVWLLRKFHRHRREFRRLMESHEWRGLRFTELRGQAAVAEFLDGLRSRRNAAEPGHPARQIERCDRAASP